MTNYQKKIAMLAVSSLALMIILLTFYFVFVFNKGIDSGWSDYYVNLAKECDEHKDSRCCLDSVATMAGGGYLLPQAGE